METTKLNYDTTCMDLNAFLIEWCNFKIFCCWIGEVLQRSMVASFPRNQLASYCFHIFVSYYCPYAYMTKLSFFSLSHTRVCVCVPINETFEHWFLMVVCIDEKKIFLLDSYLANAALPQHEDIIKTTVCRIEIVNWLT